MKQIKLTISYVLVLFISIGVVISYGQNNTPPKEKFNKDFDQKTVETLMGVITEVKSAEKRTSLLEFVLKTDKESVSVHLAPFWFVDEKGFGFSVNENVTVRGSRVQNDGKTFIVAEEVTKDEKVLKIRDSEGTPLWIGWGSK